MSETVLEQDRVASPEAVKLLFEHLVEAPLGDPNTLALHEAAEAVWRAHPVLAISQGEITGTFGRESVAYYLGSSAGFSIFVDVETVPGDRNVQLQWSGRVPAIDIQPVSSTSPLLEVRPTTPDYASTPIEQAFDWYEIIGSARKTRKLDGLPLYLVAFRSTLKPGADTTVLTEHDHHAHEAAMESPALIHYFAGEPDESGQALSFCLWEDAESAKAISRDQRHMDATKMVSSYSSYSVERYAVQYTEGIVRLEPIVN